MNIPAPLHTKLQNLPNTYHMDIEQMSRPDVSRSDVTVQETSSTLSYPQRIAALMAHAPSPPPLRRMPRAERQPMCEETRAMLLYVHTAAATYSGPMSTHTH